MDPHQVRLAVFISGFALLYAVESIFACRPWHARRSRRLLINVLIAALNTVLIRLTIAGPLIVLADHVHEQQYGLAPWLGLTGWKEIVTTIVVLDLADYWWHRFNHRIPVLWRFHQVHHVDTHVDVTTALRFHGGELMLSGLAKASWILIWGPSILGFAAFEILISLAAQYHHTNFDFSDRVETVVRSCNVTPRMHASHHSAVTPTLNSNFSTIFSFWDRMFGTFSRPGPEDLRVMGLKYGRDRDLDVGYLLLLPFRKLVSPGEGPEIFEGAGGSRRERIEERPRPESE